MNNPLKNCLILVLVSLVVICGVNQAAAKKKDKTRYVEYRDLAATVPVVNELSTITTADFSVAEASVPGSVNNGGFETGGGRAA
jgi:hypothetical protein